MFSLLFLSVIGCELITVMVCVLFRLTCLSIGGGDVTLVLATSFESGLASFIMDNSFIAGSNFECPISYRVSNLLPLPCWLLLRSPVHVLDRPNPPAAGDILVIDRLLPP